MSSYFVHESSCVEEGSSIGNGTKIWHFSHVMSGASIYDSVTLEGGVSYGPFSVFTNLINSHSFTERMNVNEIL